MVRQTYRFDQSSLKLNNFLLEACRLYGLIEFARLVERGFEKVLDLLSRLLNDVLVVFILYRSESVTGVMGLPGSQHGIREGTLGAPRRPLLESLSARGRRAAQ